MADRPDLTPELSEREFRRWYWTLAELQPFARSLGVSATGVKPDVADRIAAALGGREIPTPPSRKRSNGPQLRSPLDRSTIIPEGQRSTKVLREFFEAEIGPSFRFNGHMRPFLAAGGATLGEAIDHWYRTVGTELPPQSASLEFNRFTRAWHAANPDGTAEECRAAWMVHRSLPVDERPEISSTS